MIWILAVIVKKLNIGKGFEKSIEDIVLEIKKSDKEKEKAIELRDEAQRILDNVSECGFLCEDIYNKSTRCNCE